MHRSATISTVLLSFLPACYIQFDGAPEDNPNHVQEVRPQEDIVEVVNESSLDVRITTGQATSTLTVWCTPEALPDIETRVQDGVLTVDVPNHVDVRGCSIDAAVGELSRVDTSGSGNLWVRGASQALVRVHASGSGDVFIGTLVTTDLTARAEGSGDLTFRELTAASLDLTVEGSGCAELAGEVPVLSIDQTGSGDVDAESLWSEDVTLSMMGSGDAEVTAATSVTADLFGSGDLTVFGQPATRDIDTRGSGDVDFR